VESKSKAWGRGQPSGLASGRSQLGLEYIPREGRAGHVGIGGRDSPEDGAGSGGSVQHCAIECVKPRRQYEQESSGRIGNRTEGQQRPQLNREKTEGRFKSGEKEMDSG